MQQHVHPSRRDFVKQSSVLAGGLIASPLLSHTNFFSGSDDTIKVALIGCGYRGTGAAMQALLTKQNVKLVAMADVFRDRLDSSYRDMNAYEAEAYNIEGIEASATELKSKITVPEEHKFVGFDSYKKAIPLADVVILATPPGFRPLHFEECVRQGKHVFMEKPVATDPAGIRKVLEAAALAKQKKLNVVVGLQRHYQNSYRELFKRKELIGDIVAAQAWWNNDGVWMKKREPDQTEMEYQLRNWYYFVWLCGDHIVEQHVHNIDVINWFKGSYPVRAQGMGGREVRKGKEFGEIFDHHYVEFTYADGSILNSQCRHIPGTMSKVDELIIGTKGKISCMDANIRDRHGNLLYQFDLKTENAPWQTEHDELFEAVEKSQYKFADAENAAKSTMTAIMGRMATYSGQSIEWDNALNSELDLQPRAYDMDALPGSLPDSEGNYTIAVPGKTRYS